VVFDLFLSAFGFFFSRPLLSWPFAISSSHAARGNAALLRSPVKPIAAIYRLLCLFRWPLDRQRSHLFGAPKVIVATDYVNDTLPCCPPVSGGNAHHAERENVHQPAQQVHVRPRLRRSRDRLLRRCRHRSECKHRHRCHYSDGINTAQHAHEPVDIRGGPNRLATF
jgi:hypothetical protein